jgi:putative CocE/NonD family hydrolase
MQVKNTFPYETTEIPDMSVVLPDGCRLSARVFMPKDAQTGANFPAILEFLPYRKRDGTVIRDALTHPYFAGHGYVCLRVDMRGNGDSHGFMEDEYSPQELQDACDVLTWITTQVWSSGTVGMMGISWGGFNALQVAALKPTALKAIITLCSTVDRYHDDIHFKGGCLLNENLGWGATMWSYSSRPPDPALVGSSWRDMWLERLNKNLFLPELWLNHQRRDAYWKHGSVIENYSAIKVATLSIGGWGDSYKNAVPALVENLSAPVKGIIGPWVHKYPHFAMPEPRIGFLQEALRWWDRWLKGKDTGVEHDPDLRAYMMDGVRPASWYRNRPGHWAAENVWPAPSIKPMKFHLNDAGHLDEKGGRFAKLIASPAHCGIASGEYCAIWLGPEMPSDQRVDDAMSACFDTKLDTSCDILGAPVVQLRLIPQADCGQVVVRLNHVHPDGASTRITYGVLNLTHHLSHESPSSLTAGQEIIVDITLDQIGYRLPKGHRLRIAVSTAYWPLLWPTPRAAPVILTGGFVIIPRRPQNNQINEWSFEPAESAQPLQATELKPAYHVRRSEIDQKSGVVSLIIEDNFGTSVIDDHGLIAGSSVRERWNIHPDDPLSARGEAHWTQINARKDGWATRSEARCGMTADQSHFHLWAELEAFETREDQSEEQVLSRSNTWSVPRDFM